MSIRGPLPEALARLAAEQRLGFTWRETDPDVFGEELVYPAYRDADRIAVIVTTLHRS